MKKCEVSNCDNDCSSPDIPWCPKHVEEAAEYYRRLRQFTDLTGSSEPNIFVWFATKFEPFKDKSHE